MKIFQKICLFLIVAVSTAGCANMNVQDYKDREPRLVVEDYFSGQSRAWGVFQDRFGKVRRQFTVDIVGEWNEEKQLLTLTEDFVYDDGQTERRVWEITKINENTYEGFAGGVVGKAAGKTAGNALNFKYTFDLPVNGQTWRVKFDDWMYLQDNNVLFNKATISKWGLHLGDVYIFFERKN